jgi:tripartite-type tricarboxylate transporter receptor subunit TctC
LPDVPTIAESALPGYEYVGAIGLSAPAATPRELVNRLNAAISAILNKQELREAIGKSGFEAKTSSSEQFAAFVRDDIAKIEAVVKGAGLQAD